jgi:hypothetical protein
MPDFEVADAEFDRQATILETLVATIDISARQDGITRHVFGGEELPIIPSGGQNTMAAAAVVLLAAHFEEYVRQQVEEYATAMIAEHAHLTDDFRDRLTDVYWRAGSSRLNRIRPRGNPLWASSAGSLLRALLGYPVEENIGEFIADVISEHENNMRWETITELTGRIGVKKLSDLMFKSSGLKNEIGNLRRDEFAFSLRKKLNDFYNIRNGIVHSITQNIGIGATVFRNWAEFFKVFATAFATALAESFALFTTEVTKRKATGAPS